MNLKEETWISRSRDGLTILLVQPEDDRLAAWLKGGGNESYHLEDEGHGATDANRLVEAQLQVLWRGTKAEKTIRETLWTARLASWPFIIGWYRCGRLLL